MQVNRKARLAAILVGAGASALVAQLIILVLLGVPVTALKGDFLALVVIVPLGAGGFGGDVAQLGGRPFSGFKRLMRAYAALALALLAGWALSMTGIMGIGYLIYGVYFAVPATSGALIGMVAANLAIRRL